MSYKLSSLFMILLLAVTLVQANERGRIAGSNGEVASIAIPQDLESGDLLVLELRPISGNLVPILALQDENERLVARGETAADNSARLEFEIEEDGEYNAIVAGNNGTIGDFLLNININGEILPTPELNLAEQAVLISNSSLIRGRFTPSDEEDIYYVYISRGRQLELILERTNNPSPITLSLASFEGDILLSQEWTGSNASLQFRAEETGWYQLSISRSPVSDAEDETYLMRLNIAR